MPKKDPLTGKIKWYKSQGAISVYSALISILIGMAVGAIIIIAVGLSSPEISGRGVAEGVKLVFLGVLSTGRDASGQLSFGFNGINLGNMLFGGCGDLLCVTDPDAAKDRNDSDDSGIFKGIPGKCKGSFYRIGA